MIMNGIAILLLVFGIMITIAAIIYMLADFIFIGVVKNKKENIKGILSTDGFMLGVGLLLSSIGYILGRKMLGEMGVEIRLIVIASIISAVPTFFVRLKANYEGIYQKKESNTQEKKDI